ncbi:MAG TPA: aldose 1-epimerase [Polyangiaceae bacterium]
MELELWPSLGGSIAGFTWQRAGRRVELMRRATARALPENDARELASFPLFPFSNRVKDGRFTFGGREVELAANMPPDHPIHGHVWQRPSQVAAQSPHAAELVCHYPGADFPWAYTARQRFVLSPEALTVELELVNDSSEPMPCGFGMHPYYDRTERVRLSALAPVRWVGSQYLLPEWSEPVPEAWNFSSPRELSPLAEMDGCFGQFGGKARLEWPEKGMALEIEAEPIFGVMVVYVPAGQDFFCVETVSNVNDAFNLEARGVQGNGTIVLAPGHSARGSMRYTPQLLA